MKRSLLLLATGLTIGAASAGSGQVPEHILALRSAGVDFHAVTLFNSVARSAATTALWDRACADALVIQLDPSANAALIGDRPEHIALQLPSTGSPLTADLERVDITTDDFSVMQASTNSAVDYAPGLHYRGMLHDQPGSLVAISVFEGEVMGLISTKEADLVLGRIEGRSDGLHLLYRTEDLLSAPPFTCDTRDDDEGYTKDQLKPLGAPKTAKCVRLYWEVNYDIFQGKGSVVNATNYVTGLFNQSAILYNNDGISVTLSQVFVWDVASPYTSTSTSTLLDQFGNYRTSFNGDLAHLLGYAGGGGIAWLNGLCNSQTRYKMAYSGISSSFQNVPTFSWSVEVVTHEQGHLMGSKHTHACAWNGNNTAIDGCGPTAGYTEGSCATGPVPSSSVGGTIMSYCHLLGSVGINFNNGFGPQPTTLIVNNINGASCLTACSGGGTCTAPTGLSAGSITSNSAVLSWVAASGASSYTLQWKASSASTFTQVTGITTTSYSLSGLAAGTSYDFKLLTVCASGSSAYTGITSFNTAAGACSDNYEPNNTNGTAVVIPVNTTVTARIGSATDQDWFRFSNTTAQRNIRVTLTNLPANYTLRLYRGGTVLATSSNSGTNDETIVYNTNTVSNNYRIRVIGVSGAYNNSLCYALNVQIGATAFSTMGMDAGTDGFTPDEEVVTIYPNPASDAVNIVLPPSEQGTLVELLDGLGRTIESFSSGSSIATSNISFDVSAQPEGIYLVRAVRGDEVTVQRLVIRR